MPYKQALVTVLCAYLVFAPAALPEEIYPRQPGVALSDEGGFLGGLTRPYRAREIPPSSLINSIRLEQLLRAGNIYLSLQDAIALALENNLDVEMQRYGRPIAESDILRAEAGSLIRGVSTSIQRGARSAGGGGGVLAGSGLEAGGGGGTTGGTFGGLTIQQIGATIPSLDPVATAFVNWSHSTQPLTSRFVTGTNFLVSERNIGNFSVSKGFLTGTNVEFGFNNLRLEQNSGRNDFNPSRTGSFSLTVSQRLLQGFGLAVNSRNIRIARNNRDVSDLVFRQQVMETASAVVRLYWDLVSFREEVKVKQQTLALAEKLYNDNKKQVEIGTLAPIEIVRAEAEVARSQSELTTAETQLLQQEIIIKNALTRTGVSSPLIADARLIPTDQIRLPSVEAVEPVQDLVERAMQNRPELAQAHLQIENSKLTIQGTKSALLPSLDAFVTAQNNALVGQINTLPIPPVPGIETSLTAPRNADRFFIGGYGTVLSQLFARNFPDYGVGFQLNIPLRNRSAQADMIRNQLTLRQQEIRQRQLENQVRVDVQTALIAAQQARARYDSAAKARVLQEQTLDAEQKKYALGASTIFFVIQAQRDLAQARSAEVAALSAYAKAKVDLDQATGQTLQTYSISLEEAYRGQVSRPPSALPVLDVRGAAQ